MPIGDMDNHVNFAIFKRKGIGASDFMKKVLLVIFAACLLQMNLLGCGDCADCTEPPEPPTKEPFYINNSGIAVKITFITENSDYFDYEYVRRTQEIENNDTLCNYYLNKSCSVTHWNIPSGYVGMYGSIGSSIYFSVYFKIEFLSEPKVCLVFDGDDRVENDIRYWENYTLIEELSTVHFYSYTITPEHKAMAREEYCGE